MSSGDQKKKRNEVPRVLCVVRKEKADSESSDAAAKKVPRLSLDASPAKPQADALLKDVIGWSLLYRPRWAMLLPLSI